MLRDTTSLGQRCAAHFNHSPYHQCTAAETRRNACARLQHTSIKKSTTSNYTSVQRKPRFRPTGYGTTFPRRRRGRRITPPPPRHINRSHRRRVRCTAPSVCHSVECTAPPHLAVSMAHAASAININGMSMRQCVCGTRASSFCIVRSRLYTTVREN